MIGEEREMVVKLVELELKTKKRNFPFLEPIHSSRDAGKFFQLMIGSKDREFLTAIGLDVKGRVNYYEVIHIGTLSESLAHPREVFKTAILTNSDSIILSHNHPSGNVTPSKQDRKVTQILNDGGAMLGINILDHLIVSPTSYYSIREDREFSNDEW